MPYAFMETETLDPYALKLVDEDLQAELDLELCAIVTEAVGACADRDWDLRQLRMQLEGWSQPVSNNPWPGACSVESTISREIHTTLTAAIWSAGRQHPMVCMEATKDEDVDAASKRETYLNLKAQQCGFDASLKDAIYLALEGRFAPMFISYEKPVTHRVELDEENQPCLARDVGEGRLKFRTMDPWNIYPFPVTASGPQLKDGCAIVLERMCLTEQQLVMGIVNEGYLRDQVLSMLESGPCGDVAGQVEDDRNDEYDRDGIQSANTASRSGGTWFCYQMVGRMPWMRDADGDARIPEPLRYIDCLWMICPALNIVFKQAYSPFPENFRPYVNFRAIKKPNRWQGDGPVSIISPLHEEMTSCIRFGINNMNLEASPTLVADERWRQKYPNWTIAPGRILPRMPGDQVGPRPLVWDVRSQALVPQWLERLDRDAHRLAASEGINQGLGGKSRKAAEVHYAESMQQTKFDLFLSNIQEGIVEAFEIMNALLLMHMEDDGDQAYSQGQSASVTKEDLQTSVRFFAQAASDSLTPAARLSRMQGVAEIVMAYWNGLPMWTQLQQQTGLPVVGYMWHLHHRLLTLAQERAPERYLGPDPTQQQGQQGPPQQPPGVQALAALLQGGSPNGAGGGDSPGSSPQPPSFGGGQMMGGGMLQASPFAMNGAGGGE